MAFDKFGFGVEQIDAATEVAENIAKDHLHVWNRLVENKGPIGLQKDTLQWKPRIRQLVNSDTGFKNFLDSKTVKEKMAALRDTGLNADMDDQSLAEYLVQHVSSGLTEDPKISQTAKRMVKEEGRTFGDYAKQAALTGVGAAAGLAIGGPTGLAIGGAAGAVLGSGKKEMHKPIWKREDKSLF